MVAFITSGFALVGTLAALIVPRQRRQGRQLELVREQVQNSHGTNLRDDIDALAHRMDMLLEGMSTLRLDVTWLRREQVDVESRLTNLEGPR